MAGSCGEGVSPVGEGVSSGVEGEVDNAGVADGDGVGGGVGSRGIEVVASERNRV